MYVYNKLFAPYNMDLYLVKYHKKGSGISSNIYVYDLSQYTDYIPL